MLHILYAEVFIYCLESGIDKYSSLLFSSLALYPRKFTLDKQVDKQVFTKGSLGYHFAFVVIRFASAGVHSTSFLGFRFRNGFSTRRKQKDPELRFLPNCRQGKNEITATEFSVSKEAH